MLKIENTCNRAPEHTYLYVHKCKYTVTTPEAPAVGRPCQVDETISILHLWLSELYIVSHLGN